MRTVDGPTERGRRRRRRAGRAVRRAAPGRRRAAGHRGRARGRPRRAVRADRRRRLPLRHRPDRADHAASWSRSRSHAVGEELDDWLTLHRLDPAYRARFADGSTIDVRADVDDDGRRDRAAPAAPTTPTAGCATSRSCASSTASRCRTSSSATSTRRCSWSARRSPGCGDGRLPPAGAASSAHYVDDERLRRLFSFQAMYAGLAPKQALAIYAVITYMDCVEGVYFPEGGMHAVPRALAGAAAEARRRSSATAPPSSAVEVTAAGPARVITADGERIPADVVVVNADLPTAYDELLPPGPHAAAGAAAALLAVGRRAARRLVAPRSPTTAHHTIDFGAAWESTFDRDHRPRRGDERPVVPAHHADAHRPLARTGRPAHLLRAVPGAEHPRPRRLGARSAARYRDHMVETLEKRGYAGFGAGIEVEHLVTPADWQAQGLAAGAPFAAAHTFGQTGPFRPPTLDRRRRQPRVLRLEHPARRRRADGAGVRPAGRRARHRASDAMIGRCSARRELDAAGITAPALRASYAALPRDQRRARHDLLPRDAAAAAGQAAVRARAVRLRPPRRRHRRRLTPTPRRPSARDRLRRLERRTSSPTSTGARPATRSAGPCIDTITRWQIPTSYFADFLDSMRMDLTVTVVRDLRRPRALHVGLGRGDRPADAADPRPRRRRRPLGRARDARDRARHGVPADELPARRRRGPAPRPRLPAAGVAASSSASTATGSRAAGSTSRSATCWPGRSSARGGSTPSAAPGIELVHPTSRDCLRTAFTLYAEILDEIERADYDVFSGRVQVGLRRRAAVGLHAACARWRRGAAAAPPGPHPQRSASACTSANPNSRSSTGA